MSGSISKWEKKVGERCLPGDAVAQVETDKASVSFDAQDEFFIAKFLVEQGQEVAVGAPIMVTVEEESAVAVFANYVHSTADTKAPQPQATPAHPPQKTSTVDTHSATQQVSTDAKGVSAGSNLRLSPAAKHFLESHGYDARNIVGTSKHGIISKADVLIALRDGKLVPLQKFSQAPVSEAPTKSADPATSDKATTTVRHTASSAEQPSSQAMPLPVNSHYEDIPASNMRKVIAKRLTQSKATVPHSYMTIDCELDAMLAFRSKLKADLGVTVSVNDLVIKAAALALRDVPEANAQWAGDKIKTSSSVDISIAVATPNGLITPILTHADQRGLDAISKTVRDLATRARDGKLKPEEYQGGTFTISNLGMFGISEFSAVINPPQSCILAVGGGIKRVLPPKAGDSKPRVATVLTVQLSADRRVVDETVSALFLQAFREYIANPMAATL